MPARLVQVTLVNNSDYPICWLDDGRTIGFWQEPWFPSNLKDLKKGEQGTWRLDSGNARLGVEGWAKFVVNVPPEDNIGLQTEFIHLDWELPFLGDFVCKIAHTRPEPPDNDPQNLKPSKIKVKDLGFTNLPGDETMPSQIITGDTLIAHPVVGDQPLGIADDLETEFNHIWWTIEVLDA